MSVPIPDYVVSERKLNEEIQSINPSTLVTFFEFDLREVAFDKGLITDLNNEIALGYIFRFHNNVVLTQDSLFFNGKEYIPAPIKAEGFEFNSRGTLPVPKISITANDDGIEAISSLKQQISKIGDLTGVKVTRRRTLVKFLDADNLSLGGLNSDPPLNSEMVIEFPKDVYFIDRKSLENKYIIEYELSSILDIEGVMLPGRIVSSKRCLFTYRGAGCMYAPETSTASARVDAIHGEFGSTYLPIDAPPVANDKDEPFTGTGGLLEGTTLSNQGKYNPEAIYYKGNYVYLEKDGIRYYYVAKTDSTPVGAFPPNIRYWLSDSCSHTVPGCKLRWGIGSPGKNSLSLGKETGGSAHSGLLPFGGFPSTNRFT